MIGITGRHGDVHIELNWGWYPKRDLHAQQTTRDPVSSRTFTC